MGRLIYSLLFILSPFLAYSQVVAIQNDMQNIIYVGIQNPLTVAIENCPSTSIELTTNNGKITKAENGHFSIIPEKVGLSTISVYKRNSPKKILIQSYIFRVNRLPVAVSFNGKTKGNIPALLVYHSAALSAYVYGLEMDAHFPIIKFTTILNRNGVEIFRRTLQDPNGTRFDETSRNFFKTLQNGDKLCFTNIVYRDMDHTDLVLEGMEFTIIDAEQLKEIGKPRKVIDPITGQESITND